MTNIPRDLPPVTPPLTPEVHDGQPHGEVIETRGDGVDWAAARAAGCPVASDTAALTAKEVNALPKAPAAPLSAPSLEVGGTVRCPVGGDAGSVPTLLSDVGPLPTVIAGHKPITHWEDPPPTSPAQLEEYLRGITYLQTRLMEAGKVPALDRGFHQKQTWGGMGRVEFSDKMPHDLLHESLRDVAGTSVTAAVRFSNGQGCPFMDAMPDVRGMAIKMNIGGQQVDILATNSITFARDAEQFMKFAEIAGTKEADGELSAGAELFKKIVTRQYSGLEAARIMARLGEATAIPIKHVAGQTYWSQPVKIGDIAGRFVFTPESGANTTHGLLGEIKDHDYLRHNMEADLEQGPVTMRIGFEAFTDDAPIKDASVRGEHVTYDVGRVVIPQRSRDSEARKHEEHVVSKIAFNPANGFRMAGTMNESNRAEIYRKDAANREAWDWDNPDVQQLFGNPAHG